MLRKLNWITLVSTMAVSAVVLFGGWYIYRHQLIEAPLQSTIAQMKDVKQVNVEWQPKQVSVKLNVNPNADIRSIVQQVHREASKQANDRAVDIQVNNEQSTTELEKWWSQALFPVAEAMSHRNYGDIPVKLSELAKGTGIQVKTEMDNKYVYVTLTTQDGEGSKVMLLPLEGESMGVWLNEKPIKDMA